MSVALPKARKSSEPSSDDWAEFMSPVQPKEGMEFVNGAMTAEEYFQTDEYPVVVIESRLTRRLRRITAAMGVVVALLAGIAIATDSTSLLGAVVSGLAAVAAFASFNMSSWRRRR